MSILSQTLEASRQMEDTVAQAHADYERSRQEILSAHSGERLEERLKAAEAVFQTAKEKAHQKAVTTIAACFGYNSCGRLAPNLTANAVNLQKKDRRAGDPLVFSRSTSSLSYKRPHAVDNLSNGEC